MLITGSHVEFSYKSIIYLLKSKRDTISPKMTVGRSQFREKTPATHLRVNYNLGLYPQWWEKPGTTSRAKYLIL